MSLGTCGSGYDFITSKSGCKEAAIAVGVTHTAVSAISSAASPFGCYYELSTAVLYINDVGEKNSTDKNRVALCAEPGLFHTYISGMTL